MSSILDALRKVEADDRRRPIRLPPAQPRPRGRLAAIVAAAAFVAGAAVVALVVALRPSTVPEPVLEPGTEVASAPAPTPVAPAAPVTSAAAVPAASPGAAIDETDSDVPDPITIFRPAPQPAPQAEVQVEALPTPAPPEPALDVLPGAPAGAPDIHVSFLIYSSVPERRQVSLTIDNGPLVTLHEGQTTGSVLLVRILRDRIHVEHGGRTFSVRAVL